MVRRVLHEKRAPHQSWWWGKKTDQTLVKRKAKTEAKVLIPVSSRMATYASTAFTVQQQYGGSGVQEQQQQQYQSAELFHKARAESEQQQLQQGNGCLTQQQQQMTDETGCPVVSSTSAHEQSTDGGNGDGMRGNCNNVNGVRQHDNIGSIITMLIADQVRKVVSIPVSKLLLVTVC